MVAGSSIGDVVPRGPRRVALAAAVVVVGLLGWNVRMLVRNQRAFMPWEVIAVRPRNIGTMAATDDMLVVKRSFATYHRLRALAGKHLEIPPSWAAQAFWLERISRLDVTIGTSSNELPIPIAGELVARMNHRWWLDAGTGLGVLIEAGVDRYVVARRAGGGYDFILPEAELQRVQGTLGHP